MALIECSLPSLINDCTSRLSRFTLETETLSKALKELQNKYPLLRIHLFTESEEVRKHI